VGSTLSLAPLLLTSTRRYRVTVLTSSKSVSKQSDQGRPTQGRPYSYVSASQLSSVSSYLAFANIAFRTFALQRTSPFDLVCLSTKWFNSSPNASYLK